jgi:hypothetical protein
LEEEGKVEKSLRDSEVSDTTAKKRLLGSNTVEERRASNVDKPSKSSKSSVTTNSFVKRFLVDQMEMNKKHGYDF